MPQPSTSTTTPIGVSYPSNGIDGGNGAVQQARTVIVADGHAVVRQGICSLLADIEGIEILAQATTGKEVVELAREHQPDVVMIDIKLPKIGGVDATGMIAAASPNTHVLGLSADDDPSLIQAILQAGGRGFMHIDTPVPQMIDAIRTVGRGETYLCPRATSKVIESFVLGESRLSCSPLSVLTPREREVARLLSEGHSTRTIAEQLDVSIKTIDTHRYQVLKKLDLRGIADLTRLALREGLSTLHDDVLSRDINP